MKKIEVRFVVEDLNLFELVEYSPTRRQIQKGNFVIEERRRVTIEEMKLIIDAGEERPTRLSYENCWTLRLRTKKWLDDTAEKIS